MLDKVDPCLLVPLKAWVCVGDTIESLTVLAMEFPEHEPERVQSAMT